MGEKILLSELAKARQAEYPARIVLAKVGNKLRELTKKADADADVSFVTTADKDGLLTYKRSATLVMLKALYDIIPREDIGKVKIEYSLSKGYYCTLSGSAVVDEAFLKRLKDRMQEIIDADLPIEKKSISTNDAIEHFHRHGMYDKEKLFKYRRSSRVN